MPIRRGTPPVVDSDIEIFRDIERVDCYVIAPFGAADGRGVSVPATLLEVLAETAATRGIPETLRFLQQFRDYEK